MEIVIKVLCVIAGMLIVWFCVELYRKYQASVISKKCVEEDDFIWDSFEQDIEDMLAERDSWEVKPKKKVAKKAVKKTTKKATKKKTKK